MRYHNMGMNFGNILLSGHLLLSIVLMTSALSNEIQPAVKGSGKVLETTKTPRVTSNSSIRCQNKREYPLNEELFGLDSCVQCYFYMPNTYFDHDQKLSVRPDRLGILYSNNSGNVTMVSLRDEGSSTIIASTFNNFKGFHLWESCCKAAQSCCQTMQIAPALIEDEPYCKRQWDGWQCIPDTPAGTTIPVLCPSYIYFFGDPPTPECPNYGSKTCNENATWIFKTDYSSCGQTATIKKRMYVNIGAFSFSLVFLIPAVIIFFSYKQLRVPRVVMHTNLFISLIINGIVVILYKFLIGFRVLDKGSDVIDPGSCKFALALSKYTRMTTYMWMFCEGFYLHKLIVAAFAEEKRLIVYYLLGWVFPAIPVTLYAIMRKVFSDSQCWMLSSEEGFEWIINAPMLLSLALNLIFLCNIIRVLITKLQAAHSNEPSQYRKAVRATVVLVPLFGLHFLLTIYLPNHGGCGAIEFYYYFSYLIDGLQGFIVSLIFCYLNGEVLHLLKRSYQRHRLMNDPTGRYNRASVSTQMMSVTEIPSTCGKNSFPMR